MHWLHHRASLTCWLSAGSQNSPKQRHAHGMAINGSTLYIFGGRDGYQPVHFDNRVFAFDLRTNSWASFKPSGHPPSGRSYITCTVSHNHLFVFGSQAYLRVRPSSNIQNGIGGYWWDGREHYLNDTHALNLTTNEWTFIETKGTCPAERNRNVYLTLEHTGHLFLMGGNFFDPKTRSDKFFDDIHILSINEPTPGTISLAFLACFGLRG